MPRLGRARPWLCLALIIAASNASWAADKFCVVDAKLKPGGMVSLAGDVTVPVPAQLKTVADAPVYGDVAIVFPMGALARCCADGCMHNGRVAGAWLW